MISAADTKAILRLLSDALRDEGHDLLTSIEIGDDPKTGQLEVRLKTREFSAIEALRGLDGIEDQILRATQRPNMFFSLHED